MKPLYTIFILCMGLLLWAGADEFGAGPTSEPPPLPTAEETEVVVAEHAERIAAMDAPADTNSTFGVVEPVEPRRTVVTIWLTDDLTGEPYAAVVHRSVRPVSFYKVEIDEE